MLRSKFLLALTLVGCVTAQNVMAKAANEALPLLVREYKREELVCVSMHDTEKAARECIADVEARWSGVWKAWDELRKVDMTVAAWCTFVRQVDAAGVELPHASVEVCR
jgi:hypothetical protein